MRISTSQLFNNGISSLNQKSAQFSRIQQQIANETKILTPSDNPADATRIVDINRTLERNDQFKKNGDLAFNRLQQSETTLSAVSDTADRVRGIIFASTGQDVSSRQQLARQLREELSLVTDLANTRAGNGEYLYSGHDTNTQPFTLSGAGNVTYNGDQGQRNIQIAENRRVVDGNSGFEVFEDMSTGRSVFTTIENIIATLENATSTEAAVQAAVDTATTDLDVFKENLTGIRNSVASRSHMIQREEEINVQMKVQLEDLLSGLNDVDRTEAILKLNELQVTIQAAQQTFVRTRELSLFNLL